VRILENLTPDIATFPDFPGISEIPPFDKLWLGIYQRLGELCVDERPAVRKSAGQTLFSTIAAHSNILNRLSWDCVMWQVRQFRFINVIKIEVLISIHVSIKVLFPLLEAVEKSWKNASCEKVDNQNALLIHHSRNTEQKQWAETQVFSNSNYKVYSNSRN
jgi:hypothetical protein